MDDLFDDYEDIDLSDIPEIPDNAVLVKNPFYEMIMKYGFSITEHYCPEDIAKISSGTLLRRIDILELDPEEQAAMERYKAAHGKQ